MQFLKFLSLLQKHGLSYAISEFSFSSPKTWTIISNFWNFFLISINMDYHMQVSRNCFPSLETWTIICKLWNFFPFSKNVDYHMQFMEFLFLLQKCGLSYAIFEIFSRLQKHGLSYEISGIFIPSPKT